MKFIVPGDPFGHVAATAYSKNYSKQYAKFIKYAKFVRYCAIEAGIRLPLNADISNPLLIKTFSYFRDRRHCDPENVRKGICDALFYDPVQKKKGNDKYTAGYFPPPRYDPDNPRVVVVIREYGE